MRISYFVLYFVVFVNGWPNQEDSKASNETQVEKKLREVEDDKKEHKKYIKQMNKLEPKYKSWHHVHKKIKNILDHIKKHTNDRFKDDPDYQKDTMALKDNMSNNTFRHEYFNKYYKPVIPKRLLMYKNLPKVINESQGTEKFIIGSIGGGPARRINLGSLNFDRVLEKPEKANWPEQPLNKK